MGLNWTTHQIAALLGAEALGADVPIDGLIHDTRKITPAAMFLAFKGEHSDGHDFLLKAKQAGASSAMVSRAVDCDLPQVVVDDVLLAAGQLAARWRASLDVKVVGITVSNGKTSVKEMVCAVLESKGHTLATEGNYNNEIGVPITLARLTPDHEFAVIEMGAAREGDIRYLSHLVRPAVGILTNAGPAHLETFGSIETIVRTKGELFGALSDDGTAIINADSPHVRHWRDLAAHCHSAHFGIQHDSEFRARIDQPYEMGQSIAVDTPDGEVHLTLQVPGQHNVMNALAAMAACHVLGVSPIQSASQLSSFLSVSQRLQIHHPIEGLIIVDDSYNANPTSTAAGLEVLSQFRGARWLAMGDMLELGEDSPQMHAELGHLAKRLGLEKILAYGPLSRSTASAFGPDAEWFESQEDLIDRLVHDQPRPLSILVKGSRSMRMDRVVDALLKEVA